MFQVFIHLVSPPCEINVAQVNTFCRKKIEIQDLAEPQPVPYEVSIGRFLVFGIWFLFGFCIFDI